MTLEKAKEIGYYAISYTWGDVKPWILNIKIMKAIQIKS